MNSNKKLIIIVVTIVAVGLAIVMGVRSFTGQGRVDREEAQRAIEQAASQQMDPSRVQSVREQDRRAPMGVGRLPGNKGGGAATAPSAPGMPPGSPR